MAGAVIGALRVNLGMDSAQFRRGLKGAETGMQRFARLARTGLVAATAAATAATTALGFAVRGTITEFDELTKLGRSIGVPVEELSRLRHAADLSGLSVENLGTGMRSLSQRMVQVAQGAGEEARRGFEALGVEIQNTDGSLRTSTEVMNDIADRFATMEDGAAKTGLAVQLFGRQGAAMVNMLNLGSAGLAEMGDEAERLGLVISQSTGEAAERFNDNLTRIQRVFDGLVNTTTTALLPALDYLADAMFNSTANGEMLRGMAHSLAEGFKLVVSAAVVTGEAIKGVAYSMTTLMNAMLYAQRLDFGNALVVLQHGFQSVGESAANAIDFVKGLWDAVEAAPGTGGGGGLGGGGTPFEPVIAGAGAAADAIDLVGDSIDTVADKTQSFAEMASSAFSGIGSELVRAFTSGGNAAKNALEAITNRFVRLGEQLLDMATNQLISQLLGSLFGGMNFTPGGINPLTGLPPMFANGTNFAPGGLAVVGERGPELVNLPRGSQVFSNSETRSMMGSGSSVLRIELDPGLHARMLQESGQQTVQIVDARVPNMIKTGAPAAVARAQRNHNI